MTCSKMTSLPWPTFSINRLISRCEVSFCCSNESIPSASTVGIEVTESMEKLIKNPAAKTSDLIFIRDKKSLATEWQDLSLKVNRVVSLISDYHLPRHPAVWLRAYQLSLAVSELIIKYPYGREPHLFLDPGSSPGYAFSCSDPGTP